MIQRPLSPFFLIAIACLVGLPSVSSASEPRVAIEIVGESVVDREALTFAVGSATRFSQTANGRTHQQSPLVTYRGYQYVTYFDADRKICLGRRNLMAADTPNASPSGSVDDSWEVIKFGDHVFETNDSHNSAVIGICDKDGTIHMAFDHHATPLNYRVSKLGVAHDPESVAWTKESFSEVRHTLGEVEADPRFTYPRFFATPDGDLMLAYRGVTSADGNGMIEHYDGDTHRWLPGMGAFISRDIGTYRFDGKESQFRCAYVNSIEYAGDRLHISWVWRDRFEKTHPQNQHDLCYAYSDDDGRTWMNSDGKEIGQTGSRLIHLDSPGLVVAAIPSGSRLANQNTQFAYADGSVHVVMRHRMDGEVEGTYEHRYFHYWRNPKGQWSHQKLPIVGQRPKIFGDENHHLTLVYSDDDELLFATGTPNADRTDWDWQPLDLPKPQSIYGDAVIDLSRWMADQIISVYIQEAPAIEIYTDLPDPISGHPTPLKVVDYRLVEKSPSAED